MFRGCSACTGTADRGESPWILGISASHNGAYCLIHGDEIDLALDDGQLCSKPGPDLRALVATPWGDVEQAVTADHLAVLKHVNGQRTGHDVLARLDGALDDRALLRALCVLRQLRIIELAAGP